MSPAKGNCDNVHVQDDQSNKTQTDNIKKDENIVKVKLVEFNINKTEDSTNSKTNHKVIDDKILKPEIPLEEELLGSVTTLSSPAVRTSARVIQKMKLDSIRPVSPPAQEKKENTKEERAAQKTPSQTKPNKVIWTNIDRNLFFDAINEYGKDFEAISHYINLKQKRKNAADPSYKTKDHVRLIYYQSFHKVTKYLRFSEDIKKHVQELYALINYGEMRKKLVFVNQKACMKLKELVYKGSVTVRVKGKNIRIKTPSCKALRKLNQLEEWQEEIKLPLKVDVYLKPANSESWGRVQSLAQNPRIKTILPLQKRVVSLLKTLQTRWRSRDMRLCDQTMSMVTSGSGSNNSTSHTNHKHSNGDVKNHIDTEITQIVQDAEPILCFAPPSETVIHRPMVNLAEFMSSYSICLNSYEDRIGVTVRGEQLSTDRLNSLKEIIRTHSKRQRHDSGSGEKKSPDSKRTKGDANDLKSNPIVTAPEIVVAAPAAASNVVHKKILDSTEKMIENGIEEMTDVVNVFEMDGIALIESSADESEGKDDIGKSAESSGYESNDTKAGLPVLDSKPLNATNGIYIKVDNNEENSLKKETVIVDNNSAQKSLPSCSGVSNTGIEKSAAVDNTATTITSTPITSTTTKHNKKKDTKSQIAKKKETKRESFRPLLNDEIIKEIKKGWNLMDIGDLTIGDLYIMFGQDFKVNLEYSWVEQKNKRNPIEEIQSADKIIAPAEVKLEIFDSPVALSTDTQKPLVNNNTSQLGNKLKQLLLLANMSDKIKKKANCSCGHFCDKGYKAKNEVFPQSYVSNKIYPSSHNDNGVFRQPILPIRSGLSHIEAYRLNLNQSRSMKQSRWIKARNQRATSKQVVVQRLLPLQPGITHSYDVLSTINTTTNRIIAKPSPPSTNIVNNNYFNSRRNAVVSSNISKKLESDDDDSFDPDLVQINVSKYAKPPISNTNKIDNRKVTSTVTVSSQKTTTTSSPPSTSSLTSPPTASSPPSTSLPLPKITKHETFTGITTQTTTTMVNNVSDDLNTPKKVSDKFSSNNRAKILDDDPGIQSLMDISLPSPAAVSNIDEFYSYSSNPPMSPMTILRESPTDPKWFEDNVNDFSLSSFLGHLDSACSSDSAKKSPNHEIGSSNLSTISETSIDYMKKFEELVAQSINEENIN